MPWPPDKPPPCGGWAERPRIYIGCAQHHRTAEAEVPKYANTTEYDGDPPAPQSDPFDEGLLAAMAIAYGDTLNQHTLTDDPAEFYDFSACRKIGAKRVYAIKNWHGIWGFTSFMRSDWPVAFTPDCEGDCQAFMGQLRASPDTTKYRTAEGEFTYEFESAGSPELDNAAVVTRSTSVDRGSGFRTFGGSDSGDAAAILLAKGLIGTQDYDVSALLDFFCDAINGARLAGAVFDPITGADDAWSVDYDVDSGTIVGNVSVDLTGGTFSHSWSSVSGSLLLTLTLTATTLVYDSAAVAGGDTTHERAEITLSDAYTSAHVNDDCNELLATWNNCDALQNEWTLSCVGGPLVTRNERTISVPTLSDDASATDDSLPYRPSQPDGGIIGAPNPDGYAPHFDFYCKSGGNWGVYSPYRHATQWWAADSAPYYLPLATDLPGGPFASYAQISGAGLVKCIQAEIYLHARPPHNFQRPCGANDVAARDPASVDCITNPTGDARWPNTACDCDGEWTAITNATNATPIVITTGAAHGFSTADVVIVCGVEGNTAANGTWKLVVLSSTTAELHNSDNSNSVGNDDYTTGGALGEATPENYWNSPYKRSTYTFKQYHYNHRQYEETWRLIEASYEREQTNEDRAAEDPPLDPCPEIEAPEPFHFNVGVDGEGAPTRGTGSGPLYQFDIAEDCIELNPCTPSLILIQVAALSGCPENAKLIQPAELDDLPLDEQYGSLWQGRLDQWMTDPLWLAPGTDYLELLCEEGHSIAEDDGSCAADTDVPAIKYYPQRAFVEAMSVLPDGAPALPADAIPLGCPDYIANRDAETPIANPAECDAGCPGYWNIQLRQEECVEEAGRFAAEYVANGVPEDIDEEVEP